MLLVGGALVGIVGAMLFLNGSLIASRKDLPGLVAPTQPFAMQPGIAAFPEQQSQSNLRQPTGENWLILVVHQIQDLQHAAAQLIERVEDDVNRDPHFAIELPFTGRFAALGI